MTGLCLFRAQNRRRPDNSQKYEHKPLQKSIERDPSERRSRPRCGSSDSTFTKESSSSFASTTDVEITSSLDTSSTVLENGDIEGRNARVASNARFLIAFKTETPGKSLQAINKLQTSVIKERKVSFGRVTVHYCHFALAGDDVVSPNMPFAEPPFLRLGDCFRSEEMLISEFEQSGRGLPSFLRWQRRKNAIMRPLYVNERRRILRKAGYSSHEIRAAVALSDTS